MTTPLLAPHEAHPSAKHDDATAITESLSRPFRLGLVGLGAAVGLFVRLLATNGFGELDTLVPAYAATIHKSQGSEYPAVVIPVMTQHYTMLQRNLLYTGVTRGKQLVVLVGQKKAVAIAVKNVSGRRRWSKLREWLQA